MNEAETLAALAAVYLASDDVLTLEQAREIIAKRHEPHAEWCPNGAMTCMRCLIETSFDDAQELMQLLKRDGLFEEP